MTVERLEIVERAPFLDGRSFGDVGPYERIDAIAHYAVDPDDERNADIVDLGLAERGDDGLVRFDGDVTILRPADAALGCRTGIVEVPNRGRRTLGSLYNRAPSLTEPSVDIDPGDGLLFNEGWTMAWCGWQWDVPRSRARMGLTAPTVRQPDGSADSGEVHLRLQLHERVASVDLTDHHVGLLGGHTTLPTVDLDDPNARLLRRDGLWGEPAEVPRDRWRFARVDGGGGGNPIPDADHVWVDGGFEPGVIYDLIYTTTPLRIGGAGLLAMRDLGAFLRADAADNPCRGELDHLLGTGQSQCGRFLRHFLHLGLNRGADDTAVYDGLLVHIAGGRRGEFNHRGAQPSVQPTPGFGHAFPFADADQTDPHSGIVDGLLARNVASAPKVFFTNTSSEYWRGDASLAHTSAADGSDVEPNDDTTRHYLLASTQHGPGSVPLESSSLFGSRGGNDFNIVDFSPLMRAALFNLRSWIADGVEPPPNAIPRRTDGTATDRAAVLGQLADVGVIAKPEAAGLSTIRPLDLGPGATDGIGRYPAEPNGPSYRCSVSTVDDDGNELAGIRMPDVSVPVATHTGWNPRHPSTGAPDQILEYVGSTVPFAVDQAGREATGDPRPSIAERYDDRDAYLALVEAAALALVADRHLLECDVPTCVTLAAKRYDAITTPTR